jgi:hypothetical protein
MEKNKYDGQPKAVLKGVEDLKRWAQAHAQEQAKLDTEGSTRSGTTILQHSRMTILQMFGKLMIWQCTAVNLPASHRYRE